MRNIWYWLYVAEHIRVQNRVHMGYFFFGRRFLIVGKYYYTLGE